MTFRTKLILDEESARSGIVQTMKKIILDIIQFPRVIGIIGVLLLLLIICLFGFVSMYDKNRKLETQIEHASKTLLLLTPTPTLSPKNTFDDVEEELKKVFSGGAQFTEGNKSYIDVEGGKLLFYTQEEPFELLDMNVKNGRRYQISIQAYKYIPGLTYSNGYEGGRWTMDMDKWVTFLTKTPLGKQKGFEYNAYWGKREYETEFEGKRLGKRFFVITEEGFQPSGSWSRTYQTFDELHKQIVVVGITFYNVGKTEDLSCYPEVKGIFGNVEYYLNQ